MGRLFGTDGVRGVANRELTPELAFGLGRAAAIFFKKQTTEKLRVVIGKDTRVSGDMLEAALSAGITSVGGDVIKLGVIPTPGVAYLCRQLKVTCGVMISASHNPVPDNGIKFFDSVGYKLTDAVEAEIENIYHNRLQDGYRPLGIEVGRIFEEPEALKIYEDYLVATVDLSFKGLRVVVDCGFGAACRLAPRVLERLGAEVVSLHALNDGSRINVKCGSTDTELLRQEVIASGAHIGIAHDGDADRLIAVDEQGQVVDGDQIITICGLALLREGKLRNQKVAVTVYSNLGLSKTFQKHGAEVVVTANGDRYVLEALRQQDLVLGGEQSGHIIFLEKNTTGDGVLTALQLIAVLARSKQPLSELAAVMERFPQVLENVRVQRKEGWEENVAINQEIEQAKARLEGNGRIFVRASGTEPLIRVMAEGPNPKELTELVNRVVAVIHQEQG